MDGVVHQHFEVKALTIAMDVRVGNGHYAKVSAG